MSRKLGSFIAVLAVIIFSLTACRNNVDDAAIVSDIQAKLLQDHTLNGYYVRVESRGGAVTLLGTVPTTADKQAIGKLLSAGRSTTSLVDKMNVVSPAVVPPASNATTEATVPTKPAQPAIARTKSKSHVGMARSAQPTVTLEATPSLIMPGKVAVLAWTSQHASSLDLEPGIGRVSSQGSQTVSPQKSTTYKMTATGPAGRATATAQVNVWNAVPSPTISAFATPASIQKGHSTRLSWTSQGASSVDIEPGVGRVAPSGSTSIAPSRTTKYTLTARGQGGTQTATTIVNVTAPPQPVVVVIPQGAAVEVLTIDPIDSGSNRPNDILRASLAAPLQVGSRLTLPEGMKIYLRVLEIHPGERSGRASEIRLVLDHLVYSGQSYSLNSTDFDVFGLSRHNKNPVEADGITKGLQVHIARGARISFQLTQPVRIVLPPNGAQGR